MNSCAASCCTCFRKASCAFATSASSPTADAPRSCRFAFICSARRRKPSIPYQPPMTRTIFDSVPSVVDRCGSSEVLLLPDPTSFSPPWSLLPHETTLYHTKLLRASARSVSRCLAALQTTSPYSLDSLPRESLALSLPFHLPVSPVVLCRTASAHLDTAPSHN